MAGATTKAETSRKSPVLASARVIIPEATVPHPSGVGGGIMHARNTTFRRCPRDGHREPPDTRKEGKGRSRSPDSLTVLSSQGQQHTKGQMKSAIMHDIGPQYLSWTHNPPAGAPGGGRGAPLRSITVTTCQHVKYTRYRRSGKGCSSSWAWRFAKALQRPSDP